MNDGRGKARPEPKAVVIGGSMAGLFAALLLRRAGWQVDVYERIGAELAGRGAGIVTHRELFDVLAKAGIDTAAAALGACPNSRCSILSESDSTVGYEQVFSPLEYRSDAASAAKCAGLGAERPCLPVYR